MSNFLIFPGATNGTHLVELLTQNGIEVCISAQPARVASFSKGVTVLKALDNAEEMVKLLQSLQFDCVIDAGYDIPLEVAEQHRAACAYCDIRYLHLVHTLATGMECVQVDNAQKAAGVLSATTGRALLTIGMQDLEEFLTVPDFASRLYLRIRPYPAIMDQCISLGYRKENLIAMEGPFNRELNGAMLRQIGASLLVARATEEAGCVQEKLLAAKDVGATAIVIGKVREENGVTYSELLELLERDYGVRQAHPKTVAPYFPLFVDLREKKLMVFGGNITAAKRVETLLRFGNHVSVVAPAFDHAFDKLEAVRIERPYLRGDCMGYDYIFAVSENREMNYAVSEEAHLARIPVYVEDLPEESDFLFPDITRKGTVVVGACVPERDKKLGQSLIQAIGERLETLLPKKK